MDIYKSRLDVCSSTQELPGFDGASTSQHTLNKNGIILKRAPFHYKSESQWRTTRDAKMVDRKPVMLGCSRSKAHRSCKGKAVACSSSEVEELNERLRILEEETETMKQELLESVCERKKLMNEIYQYFQMLTSDFKFNDEVIRMISSKVSMHWNDEQGDGPSDISEEDLADNLALLNLTH